MKLAMGIVGLPNVGKSTLFKILTAKPVEIANYPFCTIDPNVGVVVVPDARVALLAKLSNSKKTVPAVMEFFDIAGLVRGASKGEGLGNAFLSHIKEVTAITHVVRIFESIEITHVENTLNPIRDIEIINAELIFKDLDLVEKRLKRAEGEAKTGQKQAQKDLETLKKMLVKLNQGLLISEFADEQVAREMQLLTTKKQIFLLNGSEGEVTSELKQKIASLGAEYVAANLNDTESLPELITAAYRTLDLISFLTTGEDETRAWTIKRGETAPQAAGAIHSDFEKRFIRAEVVFWEDLIKAGSWAQARQKGVLRTEGKEYVVKDGDVMVVKHG